MAIRALLLLAILAGTGGRGTATQIDGSYVASLGGEAISLELQRNASGGLSGTMGGGGMIYRVQAQMVSSKISGVMTALGEQLPFTGRFENETITLVFLAGDAAGGEPNADSETLVFVRSTKTIDGGGTAEGASAEMPSPLHDEGKVVINGGTLDRARIEEMTQAYGAPPRPGNYWYDAKSGLYGVWGHQAFGFMLPGHTHGKLDPRASRGDTKVFVNGRELPRTEWAIWSSLLGYPIMPGSYWLDGNGNTGYEGFPQPTDNLYLAAQRNAAGARGGSGGGDNFWSSRFSAGNSDSGNTRGYVSVPGYGPVGYGF